MTKNIESKYRSGPNLELLCIWQLATAPFCENYAKLYFDAKHLEKRLNRGGEFCGALFFFKNSVIFC